jgi:hypothetical protein
MTAVRITGEAGKTSLAFFSDKTTKNIDKG